ncbi:MAG: bifunctional UDP-2,4-diacetamido-2,4,6-trideoxy-beta-L-altropyranose hydrolase/GNAT family N-acetyltransferase [Crocinitomicaceae bacterium]
MKTLILRADGNSKIGLGHLYRLKAIGEYFERKTQILFLSKDNLEGIIPSNWDIVRFEDQDEITFIKNNFHPNTATFVLDGYNFDQYYQQKLKECGFEIAFIDDFHSFSMLADVVINPSIAVSSSDYSGSSRLALGAHFSPLRNEFLSVSKSKISYETTIIEKVFISLGGSDNNLSTKIINEINQLEGINQVHLMVGNSFNDQPLADKTYNFDLKIHKRLSANQIIDLVEKCDFAISSASTISYELCSCRIPLAIGWYTENQKDLYTGLVQKGLAEGLGNINSISRENLGVKLQEVLGKSFSNQIKRQIEVFSGLNKENIMSVIYPLLSDLEIVEASKNDLMRYFDWANDKEVRMNSFTSEPILLADHKKWFERKLKQDTCFLLMAKIGDDFAGQLRFDLNENRFEIGYSIDKNHRGKGFGTEIIACGIHYLRKKGIKQDIRAKVKSDNFASISVFKKLGFMPVVNHESTEMLIFDYYL